MTFLTKKELSNLTKEWKLGKYANWINGIEEKENNQNKTIRTEWTNWIQENIYPDNYTHFFTLTLRDNRINKHNSFGSKRYGDTYYLTPGIQRYKKAITRFENMLRRAPVTHYALVTEEGSSGERAINLHTHGVLRYTGDWEIIHPAFSKPFDEWGINQGMYRLEPLKFGQSSVKYITKYLTKENTLWHFGLFNSRKESDMREIFKSNQIFNKDNRVNKYKDKWIRNPLKKEWESIIYQDIDIEGEYDPIQFMKNISNKRK